MTQEALAVKLLSIRNQAEQTAQNINQISNNLSAERETLQQMVEEYNAKRVALLRQNLQVNGVTWCTYCFAVIPENEAELLLIETRGKYSRGYGNACYGFRGFSKLHRACPACRERAANKHGQRGAYDPQAKDQSSFYAFHVEKREDGHYARRFCNWVKLDEEDCSLDEPSSRLVERLAEEWNLPPRIEVADFQ